MEPNAALFFYNEKGVQFNALLVKYFPASAGNPTPTLPLEEGEGVSPKPAKTERVDLVYVGEDGNIQKETGVPRRGPGVEKSCFKVRG